jgi:hypothetical protein
MFVANVSSPIGRNNNAAGSSLTDDNIVIAPAARIPGSARGIVTRNTVAMFPDPRLLATSSTEDRLISIDDRMDETASGMKMITCAAIRRGNCW